MNFKRWSRRRIVVVSASAVFVVVAIVGLLLIDQLAEGGHERAVGPMIGLILGVLGICFLLVATALLTKLREVHFKLGDLIHAMLRGHESQVPSDRKDPKQVYRDLLGEAHIEDTRKEDR